MLNQEMEVFRNLKDITRDEYAALTVGTFDGIHLGHQAILARLKEKSAETGGTTTLVTFEPHPQLVLKKPDKSPIGLLTTIEEKIAILKKLGLERLVIFKFTPQAASIEPDIFVRDILCQQIGFKHIVIGHDHNFGHQRLGNIQLLKRLAQQLSFSVEEVPVIMVAKETVSSTRIRNALLTGDFQKAVSFLGRPYRIQGKVERGDGVGHKLGFPTANLDLKSNLKVIPGDGIYAGNVFYANTIFKGIINIGIRPTFNLKNRVFEVHLINFDGLLYGKEIVVDLKYRLRDEVQFDSVTSLVEQMKLDREQSLQLLG